MEGESRAGLIAWQVKHGHDVIPSKRPAHLMEPAPKLFGELARPLRPLHRLVGALDALLGPVPEQHVLQLSYKGTVHSLQNVHFGAIPTRRIPIITGSMGPQSLRLTAKLGDGAAQEGRDSDELRIHYNVMGFIDTGNSRMRPRDPKIFWGDPRCQATYGPMRNVLTADSAPNSATSTLSTLSCPAVGASPSENLSV
jgi:hypothetical protein